MFNTPFSIAVRQKRNKLKMTQTKLAQLCGLSRGRWSDLETGRRRPNRQELRRIASVMQLGRIFVPPSAGIRDLIQASSRWLPAKSPFYAHQDRPTHIRFRSCMRRYGETAQGLFELIRQRPDFERCHHFGQLLSCDSGLEVLNILSLLAAGAEPGFLAPSSMGHTPLPIVDPVGRQEVGHRPHPCLKLNDTYYFFQVTFLKDLTYRVDVLRWAGAWRIFELIGSGHWSTDHAVREQVTGLPTTWLPESDIISAAVRLNTVQRAG